MFVAFLGLPMSTDDVDSALAFAEATKGIPGKELADTMGVAESQITRWRQHGHIPSDKIARLPADVRIAYHEEKLERDGGLPLRGAIVARLARLAEMFSARPVVVRASLEPTAIVGSSRRCGSERERATA